MIEKLIELSIRNRYFVILCAIGLTLAGIYAVYDTPVDAIPDLSENQVIVFTDWMGRSPREIEDQITYPLSLKLQGLAGVRAVRSSSEFNFSMITLIFADNVDFYFARQRVTEKLTQAETFLPPGVTPYMAPDATALGQIFWYTVEPGPEHPIDPPKLWALNKFYIGPQLNAARGVADVAMVGGMPLEYQVDVRPEDLRAYGVTLGDLYSAVAGSNMPAGGGVVQKNNAEYIVRGVGWIRDKFDIENTVIREVDGVPVYVRNVADVGMGTQFRRSVYEKNGSEVTGGVVLMRHGENPLAVTEAVKQKIVDLQPGLPAGVQILPAYDRTRLIHGAIHTLTEVMWHEMVIASLAILLILFHFRSVFVICITLPLSVLFSFLLMWLLRRANVIDIQANIMSLAGITISIGILVDQAIVMVENATHHLKAKFGDARVRGDIAEEVIAPCRTVGRPIFFSVMIMLLSFIPVFMLGGREGKLFHPLAFTKSFAMIGVALISVTLVPALIPLFIKGHLRGEEENAIVRSFIHIYKPLLTWALPRRNLVMWAFAAILILAAGMFPLQAIIGQGASETAWRTAFLSVFGLVTALTVIATRGVRWQLVSFASLLLLALWAYHFPKIGVAFMPALDEGTTLDMPVTVPRASVTQVADDLKARDALLRGFPEVESVIGKAGRADTPTDPAPLDMVETFVNFRPREFWPKRVLRYADAERQVRVVLAALVSRGFMKQPAAEDDRTNLINDVSQKAVERFDETLRALALLRYEAIERSAQALDEADRNAHWRQQVRQVNWELHDQGVRVFNQVAIEELVKAAKATGRLAGAKKANESEAFTKAVIDVQLGKIPTGTGADDGVPAFLPFNRLREELDPVFSDSVFLWPRQTGPKGDLVDDEMGRVLQVPGWSNIFTQPIINRIEMLSTGVRTDIGVKVFGPDLDTIVEVCRRVEAALKPIPGARDVIAAPIMGKGYVQIDIDRAAAARYGISVENIQNVIEVAMAGRAVTFTVEDRDRFPVRVRYARTNRDDEESLKRLLVSAGSMNGGAAAAEAMQSATSQATENRAATTSSEAPHSAAPQHAAEAPLVPLSALAEIRIVEGPAMIKSENGRLLNYVTLNVRGRDIVGFVNEAQRVVAEKVKLPEGVHIEWSGEFEHQVRAAKTLRIVFPVVIGLIFVILYLTYKDLADAALMMLAVPEALAGGAFFMYLFPKITQGWDTPPMDFSVAVWVGFIACFGMATETGIIMLVYLREAIDKRGGLEKIGSLEELRQAVIEGAVHRLRPKLLTEGVAIIAIFPMVFARGVGGEILAPMALPVLGGLLISDEVVDLFLPVRFYWVRRARWLKLHGAGRVTSQSPV